MSRAAFSRGGKTKREKLTGKGGTPRGAVEPPKKRAPRHSRKYRCYGSRITLYARAMLAVGQVAISAAATASLDLVTDDRADRSNALTVRCHRSRVQIALHLTARDVLIIGLEFFFATAFRAGGYAPSASADARVTRHYAFQDRLDSLDGR